MRHLTEPTEPTELETQLYRRPRQNVRGRYNVYKRARAHARTHTHTNICQLLLSGFPRCSAASGVLLICVQHALYWWGSEVNLSVCMIRYHTKACFGSRRWTSLMMAAAATVTCWNVAWLFKKSWKLYVHVVGSNFYIITFACFSVKHFFFKFSVIGICRSN
jgi:hypothetical protein